MTTSTMPLSDRSFQVIRVAEFSLVPDDTRLAVGRLRFPPGCDRTAIREIIARLLQRQATILSQQCIGNAIATTGWSTLRFSASLNVFQNLSSVAKQSNLKVVRESTQALLQELASPATTQLEPHFPKGEAEASTLSIEAESVVVECEAEPLVEAETEPKLEAEIAEWLVVSNADLETCDREQADGLNPIAETQHEAIEVKNLQDYATAEQLQSLTLAKLKELASNHNIQGRSSLVKNLDTARRLLIPKLVDLVTVAEI